MGNLIATNQISITIEKPTSHLFDFHKPQPQPQNKTPLIYPSFIKKDSNNNVEYSSRCKFTQREYELDHNKEGDIDEIVIKRQFNTKAKVWRSLMAGQQVQLKEGSVLKLADKEFSIKKICQSFHDLEGIEENLQTLSEIDVNETINLGQSFMRNYQSPYLKRSNYLDKNLQKMESMESLGGDGQFCRVCFSKSSTHKNPLLNICKCAGSVKNIHYLCLKRWISTKSKHVSCGTYEYYEYDLSCDLCKEKIQKVITHQNRKYVVYSESFLHPPFIVMAYKNDKASKVREFIINFDHSKSVTLGKNKDCDLPLQEKFISGQHCQLVYQNNKLLVNNLNPTFGTFIDFSEADLSGNQRSINLMISNHLIRLENQSNQCLTSGKIRIRLMEES